MEACLALGPEAVSLTLSVTHESHTARMKGERVSASEEAEGPWGFDRSSSGIPPRGLCFRGGGGAVGQLPTSGAVGHRHADSGCTLS